jgi:hypothetical protein
VELVKSRQRVVDHGEVFTPPGVVDAMLSLVQGESERIDSRFLEPACGSGNFLVPVLRRKLGVVRARYGRSTFERRHFALLALMSIYGIELLDDNVAECRQNLLDLFADDIGIQHTDEMYSAAANVLEANIVHGDALSMTTRDANPQPITFAEWTYLGRGKYHRRDFRLDTLARMSSFDVEGSLLSSPGKHEVFTPAKEYGSLSLAQIATGSASSV